MSITSELRLFAADPYTGWVPTDKQQADLRAIADRIDAEHQKAVDEWKAKDGQTWLHGYGECHAELMEGNEVIAADLEKAGWIKLPVDADGVPIHVGERVQIIGNDPSTVSHMSLADDGWRVYVKYDGDLGTGSGQPSRIRHHHAPTVEDVLEEFVARWMETHHDDIPALKAEYAARLRLAGDE